MEEVEDVVKVKAEAKDLEQLESQRIVGSAAHPFLIRALGLPGHSRQNDSVLMIIEAIRRNDFRVNGALGKLRLNVTRTGGHSISGEGLDDSSSRR